MIYSKIIAFQTNFTAAGFKVIELLIFFIYLFKFEHLHLNLLSVNTFKIRRQVNEVKKNSLATLYDYKLY